MKKLFPFILSLLIIGCAVKPEIIKNDADGSTTYRSIPANVCDVVKMYAGKPYIWGNIQFQKVVTASGEKYSLILNYLDADWILIPKGKTLSITTDGKATDYEGEGSENSRSFGPMMKKEKATYVCSKEDFTRIINAKSVAVRFNGEKHEFFCKFDDTYENLVTFYNEFCK